jgi:hypothetical protein
VNIQLSRRRYGRHSYCWAEVQAPDGTMLSLGDPWPAINWPRRVLEEAATSALDKYRRKLNQEHHAEPSPTDAQ